MHVTLSRRLRVSVAVLALAACHHAGFDPLKFQSDDALYQASLAQLRGKHWDHASAGFERLSTQLAARDPRLPSTYYYLGVAHEHLHEYILAAQSYSRVPESFPDDSLAPEATYKAGMAYAHLWRKPSLDPEYGRTAIATLQGFLAAYPDSPLRGAAQKEIAHLTNWLALKSYNTGVLYMKRKAYDSAIIYYQYVLKTYPQTPAARQAMMRLVETYRQIHYGTEAAEQCDSLRQRYPADRQVRSLCGAPPKTAPPPATSPTTPAPTPAVPSTSAVPVPTR